MPIIKIKCNQSIVFSLFFLHYKQYLRLINAHFEMIFMIFIFVVGKRAFKKNFFAYFQAVAIIRSIVLYFCRGVPSYIISKLIAYLYVLIRNITNKHQVGAAE